MQIISETLRSACLSALGLAGDVSIRPQRQHTSAYVSIRQHTSAYVICLSALGLAGGNVEALLYSLRGDARRRALRAFIMP
jgi:hypothetical protein